MMNINTGAVGLTGAVLVAGIATTLLWKGVVKDQLFYTNNRQKQPGRRRGSGKLHWLFKVFFCFTNALCLYSDHFTEYDSGNSIARFTYAIEKALQKYNIDATACTQRTLCMTVRDASRNVAKGIGSSNEKIFDGLLRWDELIHICM